MRFITRLVIEAVKVVGKLTGKLTQYQPVAEVGITVSKKRTRRTEKNLEFILNSFTDNNASVVDVGSNLGFYALRLGQRGMNCVGIEHNPVDWLMSWLVARYMKLPNVSFRLMSVTPKNVKSLHPHDYSLLLNVHHHWVRIFGLEAAEMMLETYWSTTARKMVASFNTSEKDMATMPMKEVGAFREWLDAFFRQRGAASLEFSEVEDGRLLVAVSRK